MYIGHEITKGTVRGENYFKKLQGKDTNRNIFHAYVTWKQKWALEDQEEETAEMRYRGRRRTKNKALWRRYNEIYYFLCWIKKLIKTWAVSPTMQRTNWLKCIFLRRTGTEWHLEHSTSPYKEIRNTDNEYNQTCLYGWQIFKKRFREVKI